MKTVENQISFNSATIVRLLIAIALLLLLASSGGQFLRFSFGEDNIFLRKLILLFHFDHEGNIPTYFSVLLLLLAAVLLALIAELNRKHMRPHASKWATLSWGFLYIAFDEAFQIHEKLIWPFQRLIGEDNLGIFYFAWVIPAVFIKVLYSPFLCFHQRGLLVNYHKPNGARLQGSTLQPTLTVRLDFQECVPHSIYF